MNMNIKFKFNNEEKDFEFLNPKRRHQKALLKKFIKVQEQGEKPELIEDFDEFREKMIIELSNGLFNKENIDDLEIETFNHIWDSINNKMQIGPEEKKK